MLQAQASHRQPEFKCLASWIGGGYEHDGSLQSFLNSSFVSLLAQ